MDFTIKFAAINQVILIKSVNKFPYVPSFKNVAIFREGQVKTKDKFSVEQY